MFKTVMKKHDVLQEFVGELKMIYQKELLEVINYQKLISICGNEVVIENILIKGENLKVIYQDPIRVIIKGKITSVLKGEKNGL